MDGRIQNDLKTIRVDANFFENRGKKVLFKPKRIRAYMLTGPKSDFHSTSVVRTVNPTDTFYCSEIHKENKNLVLKKVLVGRIIDQSELLVRGYRVGHLVLRWDSICYDQDLGIQSLWWIYPEFGYRGTCMVDIRYPELGIQAPWWNLTRLSRDDGWERYIKKIPRRSR